jgi:hypothetical protein
MKNPLLIAIPAILLGIGALLFLSQRAVIEPPEDGIVPAGETAQVQEQVQQALPPKGMSQRRQPTPVPDPTSTDVKWVPDGLSEPPEWVVERLTTPLPLPTPALEDQASEPGPRVRARAERREADKHQVTLKYSELFPKLDLPEKKLDRFRTLLLAKQQETRGQPQSVASVASPALEKTIADLLGEEQYERYLEYEQDLPGQWQVREYAKELEKLGVPLDETQRAQLITVVVEERRKLPSVSAADAVQDLSVVARRMSEALTARADNDQGILTRADTFLRDEQLAGIRGHQEEALARERKALQVYEQLFANGGQEVPEAE